MMLMDSCCRGLVIEIVMRLVGEGDEKVENGVHQSSYLIILGDLPKDNMHGRKLSIGVGQKTNQTWSDERRVNISPS